MEKVVVTRGRFNLDQTDVSEVEELLKEGWVVKSVTTEHADDYVTAIFVLQKDV